jgi:hypothetical protein
MHVAPACARSGEGSNHFGSYVRSLSLHFCDNIDLYTRCCVVIHFRFLVAISVCRNEVWPPPGMLGRLHPQVQCMCTTLYQALLVGHLLVLQTFDSGDL